jgi:hypothetical protein
MHEKMLILLVFLYITASFRQKKVILRLTGRLIIIKIWSFVPYPLPVVRVPLGCSLYLSSSRGGLRNRARSLYRFALSMSHALDPKKAADPAMRDGPRLLREEKPQRNPSADGYLCATYYYLWPNACYLLPTATRMP